MISYKKAFDLMTEKGLTATKIKAENIITQSALTSMRRNSHVNTRSIEKLCKALECQPGDIMEYIPDTGIEK